MEHYKKKCKFSTIGKLFVKDDSVCKDVTHGQVYVLGLNNVIQKLVTLTLAVVEPVTSLEKINKLGQSESEHNLSVLINDQFNMISRMNIHIFFNTLLF